MIQERIAIVEDLEKQVKEHPMTLQFDRDPHHYVVYFPHGDFPVGGVRISNQYGGGKAAALRYLLQKLEEFWVSSFPGYTA